MLSVFVTLFTKISGYLYFQQDRENIYTHSAYFNLLNADLKPILLICCCDEEGTEKSNRKILYH